MKKVFLLSAIMFITTTMFGMSNRIHFFNDGSILLPEVTVFANDTIKQHHQQKNNQLRHKQYHPEFRKEGKDINPRFNHRKPESNYYFKKSDRNEHIRRHQMYNKQHEMPKNQLKNFRQSK